MAYKPLPGNITIAIHFDEALWNNYGTCGVYSPEPRAAVYCVGLNFNKSKLVYYHSIIRLRKIQNQPTLHLEIYPKPT